MKLSKRLMNVAEFVTEGLTVADIGTDHGYIPIYLVESGKTKHALALDINKGPIMRAQEHIEEAGLQEKIETRISDGLQKLISGEAQSIIIAGMGGELMIRILENGRNVLDEVKELILSPHSEIGLVRKYLLENEFQIIREQMLTDDGKFYTIIKAVHGNSEPYTNEELKYGKLLIDQKDAVLSEFLLNEKQQKEQIIQNLQKNENKNTMIRKKQVEQELTDIKKVLDRFENQY